MAQQINTANRMSNRPVVTRATVERAAAASGISLLEAVNRLQAMCARFGYDDSLEALCAIKADLLGIEA